MPSLLAQSSLAIVGADATASRNAIRIDVSALAEFDRQIARTMLRTLETRLSAYFVVTDDGAGDLVLAETAPDSFALRAAGGASFALPRPLRLMPFADSLNAMIEAVRPATFDFDAARGDTTTLSGLVSRTAMTPVRARGGWSDAVIDPASDTVGFDKPYDFIARALAADDAVAEAMPMENFPRALAVARCVLRRDEVLWLTRTDADLQRAVAARLARADLVVRMAIWPNLARIPNHPRWLAVFARLQQGVAANEVLKLALAEGIVEAEARRGIAMLLRAGYARTEAAMRIEAPKPAPERRAPSFLAQLKSKLLQFVERDVPAA